jgi:HK97 family phage major capsid protein
MAIERREYMNLQELQNSWIEAGNKVTDLFNKKVALQKKYEADPDSVSAEDMKNAADEYNKAVKARDFAKKNYDDAVEASTVNKPEAKPINEDENKPKKNVVSGFKDMLKHPMKYMENLSSSSSSDGNAGLTIPDDQQTQINTLMRQYDDLRDLVTTENVGTDHGTRNIEPFSEIKPMDQLDDIPDDSSNTSDYKWQDKDVPEGDYSSVKQLSYTIHDYGDVFFAPNDLINDSTANIESWMNEHIARKSVVTYNSKIVGLLPNSQKKATITKLDDIIDTLGQLDMALWSGATLLTNKSGFMTLAKVRMSDGTRAMTVDPRTQQTFFNMDGMSYVNVRVTEDRYLPNNTTTSGQYQSHPFYFGDFKEFIHLYDRQQMSLLTSNIADKAFRRNQTAIRALLRFDTKIWDDEAIVSGSFDKVESQPMLMQAVSVPASNGSTSAGK